jgi:signal-transduction protein with cAMP-binding, CBS, and nucleotidyltransferase domain
VKDILENLHDEFLGGVIIIVEQNLVERRSLEFFFGLGDYLGVKFSFPPTHRLLFPKSRAKFTTLLLTPQSSAPTLAPRKEKRDILDWFIVLSTLIHLDVELTDHRRCHMLSNKVSEIMTTKVVTAGASSSIFDVMEMMAARNIGGVVLTEDQIAVGIFTDRDVLKRVMNKKLDPKKSTIKRVMTSPIRGVSQNTHVIEALGRMYKAKFRHLLVRGEKQGIVGMVSMRNILKFAVELGQGLTETKTVGSIMSRNIITVEGSQSLDDAIDIMVKKNTGCVVVLIEGKPKGIFTERDVLKRVAIKNMDTKKTAVREVMTTNVVTMPHTALIGGVLAEMYQRGFRNMPIQGEEGEVNGIVSLADVLQYARVLDVDEKVRQTWKEIAEFWDSEEQYTPG